MLKITKLQCGGALLLSLVLIGVPVMAATPPVLAISTITDQASTNNAVLNVTGTATAAVGSISTLTINGTSVIFNPTDGSFSFPVVLSPGINTVTMIATDSNSLATVVTRTVTLNSALPAFSISAPADNSTVQASSLDVTGTADNAATVIVTINGAAAQSVSRNGAAFTSTVTLLPGMNTIEVAVIDSVTGFINTRKRTVSSKSDQSLVAVIDPAEDVRVTQNMLLGQLIPGTAGSYLLVQGTASNPLSPPVAVTIKANGVSYPQQPTNGAYSQKIDLPTAQTYAIEVIATDANGTSTTTQRNIVLAGSCTGGGTVDISDALMALRITVELVPMDPKYLDKCDEAPLVNGRPQPDGKIDISDALLILKKIVGLLN